MTIDTLAKITLRRVDIARHSAADRVYEVLYAGVRIGEVVRDDVEPDEGPRHLWHAYIDEFPGTDWGGWDEAVGDCHICRGDAVTDLLSEFEFLARRLGVVLP